MLSPEAPYPLRGGGAYRTASLLHYFAGFADVDLIVTSPSGKPALLPPGLVRSQSVIPLPVHGKGNVERFFRNARRAIVGVPPLVDRLSGLGPAILEIIGPRRYDWGVIEHSWCAPYVCQLAAVCERTILDLHNVESVLHARCAAVNRGFTARLITAAHRRFAERSRELEAEFLPQFSLVLAASGRDAALASSIAPGARVAVYPNSLPRIEIPRKEPERAIAFSGNFEYHPNIDAVAFLIRDIWPAIHRRHPELRLRLIGIGDQFIRHLIPPDCAIETTGPVENALTEIAHAAVVIAPIRAGSGTRVKILEAWAAARPVIATSVAAEGLEAQHGQNIVLADTASAFASEVDRLLADPSEAQRIGAHGRLTYESSYTWEAAWRCLYLDPQVMLQKQLNRYTG